MSKSVIELINEVRVSEELQKETTEVLQKQDNQAMIDFLRRHDCDASLKEAKKVLQEEAERLKESGELTPEELEEVAGGSLAGFIMTVVGAGVVAILADWTYQVTKINEENGGMGVDGFDC